MLGEFKILDKTYEEILDVISVDYVSEIIKATSKSSQDNENKTIKMINTDRYKILKCSTIKKYNEMLEKEELICDGDIVRIGENSLGVILFDEEYSAFFIVEEDCDSHIPIYELEITKVIGNIYTDKNILVGTKLEKYI